MSKKGFDDYFDDYALFSLSKPIIEVLHAVSTFFLHPLRDMPVDVKRKGCSRMANMLLNSFDIFSL